MLKRLAHVGDRLRSKLRKRGIDYNPYDNAVRERISDRMFVEHADLGPMGSAIRSRAILEIIESGSPSSLLTDAYFSNLELLLGAKRPRQRDGQIVIGLGTGRCGSTSLVEIFSTIRDSCSTHENPPLISWSPQRCEVDFHFKRLALLSKYFPLVADVSHWWINVLDELFHHFPNAKAVGLFRDVDSCTKSFMQIKGSGRGSYNHWAPYGNGIWASAQWDPTYPTYMVPEGHDRDPDVVKSDLIRRYVEEYNKKLQMLASRDPAKILLVRTEDLGSVSTLSVIFDFIDHQGQAAEVRRNVGTTIDGRDSKFRF